MPLIRAEFEERLFGYMIRKAVEMGVIVYAINGTEDHVHAVVAIPPKQNVAAVVKRLKGASSHYVNHVICPDGHFAWQSGYGCLTVGEKQRNIAEKYVQEQKQHHASKSTNGWLERYADEDEGPEPEGLRFTVKTEVKFVRDEPGTYEIMGELPF